MAPQKINRPPARASPRQEEKAGPSSAGQRTCKPQVQRNRPPTRASSQQEEEAGPSSGSQRSWKPSVPKPKKRQYYSTRATHGSSSQQTEDSSSSTTDEPAAGVSSEEEDPFPPNAVPGHDVPGCRKDLDRQCHDVWRKHSRFRRDQQTCLCQNGYCWSISGDLYLRPQQKHVLGRNDEMLYLPATVSGTGINFKVATGAARTVISRTMYHLLHGPRPRLEWCRASRTTGCGILPCDGSADMDLVIDGVSYPQRVHVATMATEEGLLGADFLRRYGANILCNTGKMEVGGKTLPIAHDHPEFACY